MSHSGHEQDPEKRTRELRLKRRLPIAGLAGVQVLKVLDRFSLYHVAPSNKPADQWWELVLFLVWGILFDYPFFVFAAVARYTDMVLARTGRWTSAGALLGLSTAYGLGYLEMPFELTSGAPDAGQGVGLYIPLVAPIFGGFLSLIGWLVGYGAEKLAVHARG